MKNIILFALVFTAVNSSFLRELPTEIQLGDPTYTTTCFVKGSGTLSATIGEDTDLSGATGLKAKFTMGTEANDIECDAAFSSNTITVTGTIGTSNVCGTYTLKSVTETGSSFTFTVPSSPKTNFKIVNDVEVEGESAQTASQEVKEGDSSKSTFVIVFKADLDVAPSIFYANDVTKVIANCVLDSTDKEKVVCTPTKDELSEGENEIYYQKGCATTAATTNVKVTFTPSGDVDDASAFLMFSKFALFFVAVFLF